MRRSLYKGLTAFVLGAGLTLFPLHAFAFSRVKDLVDVEGIRDNMLVGYGLVVGLNGSGDSLKNAPFIRSAISSRTVSASGPVQEVRSSHGSSSTG